MKRVEQGSSLASWLKRRSASGSRSIATSVPARPSRSATRRAWPPSPKVQSIALCPGWGSSSSISSLASTGTWRPVRGRAVARLADSEPARRPRAPWRETFISSSVVDMRADLRHAAQQRRLVLVPPLPAPHLQPVARADDHDLPLQARVLAEEARDDHPAGCVQLRVVRAAVEEALQFGEVRRQGRQVSQRPPAVALVRLRLPDADARLEVHGQREHNA